MTRTGGASLGRHRFQILARMLGLAAAAGGDADVSVNGGEILGQRGGVKPGQWSGGLVPSRGGAKSRYW